MSGSPRQAKVGVATTAQLVWILAARLPEPEGVALEGRDERLPERDPRTW